MGSIKTLTPPRAGAWSGPGSPYSCGFGGCAASLNVHTWALPFAGGDYRIFLECGPGLWYNHSNTSGQSPPPCVRPISCARRFRICPYPVLRERSGARGQSHRITYQPIAAAVVQTVLPLKWSGRKRGAGLSNPVPRFRRRNGNGKNPDSQGGRVESCKQKSSPKIEKF